VANSSESREMSRPSSEQLSQPYPVVILCGGRGLRMSGHDDALPKPLVEIGGRPLLWHVMSLYAEQGFSSFVLALGYGGTQIREAIGSLEATREVGRPQGAVRGSGREDLWNVTFVDTGLETPTGGRVAQLANLVGDGTFCLTYADGLADLRLASLVDFHLSHGRAATMTVVRPRNPWGVAELDGDDRVTGYQEKPLLDCWVNGGFFVMEPRALDYIKSHDMLEIAPLESLAGDGELRAYRHEGFWDCMDTFKDTLRLNDLWDRREAPWIRQEHEPAQPADSRMRRA
jgi:glucose-1-phosphate cytidylyltransferase